MKLPLERGAKYGLIGLNATTNVKAPLDLGNGFLAVPGNALDLPDYWRKWLGTLRTDEIQEASLLLVAVGASERPKVLDRENETLTSRVDALFSGLLIAARPSFEGTGSRISGANVDGTIDVRSLGETVRVVRPDGFGWAHIHEGELRRAAELALRIEAFHTQPPTNRFLLSRTLATFFKALTERVLDERIHQFVRAVDGIIRSSGNREFRDRCRTLMTGDTDVCRELYLIRNATEHFRHWSADLEPQLPPREDLHRLFRRAHESEALARYAVTRVLDRPDLWGTLADDQVTAFWNKPEDERIAKWGERLDLAAAMEGFNTCFLPPMA
ncbi:hypothetical protein [Anaeromyxobacter paludicola]|uniref:Apea-like HEPN domain-containing protein n=1 Tax=Anaeromyxobacter paludicola TaxID=2918171 RepID=A0ABN6N8E0_9BACT|nr:hypothetical protein [Anaeromyxobacter paludicola]BDG08212.1 hypothetical protein AMPC_13250 [Anaeromyxobacter paludicola]